MDAGSEVHVLPAGQATTKSTSPTKQPQPGTAPAAAHGAAANPAAAGGNQVVEVSAVPLAKDIRSVIDTAKQEVEAAAKAYYAAKVRHQARLS